MDSEWRLVVLFLAVLFAGLPPGIDGQCDVLSRGGYIERTLHITQTVCDVMNTAIIAKGHTLHIHAGVKMRLAPGVMLAINGTLMAKVDSIYELFLFVSRLCCVHPVPHFQRRSGLCYSIASVCRRLSSVGDVRIVAKRCVLEQKLILTTYRKSCMRNRLVPEWMTLTFVSLSSLSSIFLKWSKQHSYCCRKIVSDGAEVRLTGRLFQRLAAKTGKPSLPTVVRL